MRFDRALRVARSARGFSQKELAARAGLTASYISLLESGGRRPSTQSIEQLAQALQIPFHLLLLLGAEKLELMHISEREAGVLGRELLSTLTAADLESGMERGAKAD